MKSLAKTLSEFSIILEQIEENDGVISDDLLPIFSKTELAIAQKIDDYANFYDVVKGQIDRLKRNIENFKKNLQSLENLESSLKDNVKHLMQVNELTSLHGNDRTIKLVNSGGMQPTEKPDDMFYMQDCVHPKYLMELDCYVEERIVYVIKNKEEFKEAIKKNKIKSCFLLPRSKYVKFT